MHHRSKIACPERFTLLGIIGLSLNLLLGCQRLPYQVPPKFPGGEGKLIYEARSNFSHIRIRDRGSIRTVYFVRDTGLESLETSIDLEAPHRLQQPYTRYMFASYLFLARQESCLIVGLGGGAMVHFLNHFFPSLRVDVVEIDPLIVTLADKYFGIRPKPGTRILTQDALTYLKRTKERYDIIYMDAFLKPGPSTDDSGLPMRLKTIRFFKSLHKNLKDEGLAVFNLQLHGGTEEDIENIKKAFPQVYVLPVLGTQNVIVVGSLVSKRYSKVSLQSAGQEWDSKINFGFSFLEIAKQLL